MGALVERGLREEGYEVTLVGNGMDALIAAANDDFSAAAIDVMLPEMTGFEICRHLRQRGSTLPVLLLTARDAVEDRVFGLDSGADDYLTKPFGLAELLARLRVALRHAQKGAATGEPILVVGPIRIDRARREVFVRDVELHLTPTEYRLLVLLAENAGRVLTHRHILQHVWGPTHTGHSHYVRVQVAELRKKIEADAARPQWLVTEPGVGYRLRDREP